MTILLKTLLVILVIAVVFITKRWSDDLDALMPGWPEAEASSPRTGRVDREPVDQPIFTQVVADRMEDLRADISRAGVDQSITVHPTEAD